MPSVGTHLWGLWGALEGPESARRPRAGAHPGQGLTVPARVLEVPVLPASIVHEDHEDERHPAKRQTRAQGPAVARDAWLQDAVPP